MKAQEFNNKYHDYIEANHYGLDIDIPSVINYLDEIFQDFIKVPGFSYSQIKLKFNSARFYCKPNSIDGSLVEKEINKLVKEYDDNGSKDNK